MTVQTEKLGPGVLELGDILTTGLAIQCQVREAILEFDVDEGDSDVTLCGDDVAGEDTISGKITGELYQDWTEEGVNKWSWDFKGQSVPFTFKPRTAAGLTITGTLKMRPLPIGGETKTKLLAEFEWPTVGLPTITGWTPVP